MKDELLFIDIDSATLRRRIFTHWNIPEIQIGRAYIFLNPMFDEKKRAQKFLSETSRLLSNNFICLRFDYYGTGDSAGELYEFDFEESLSDLAFLCNYISMRFKEVNEIILVGLRMGADFALMFAQKNDFIKRLILIEPIVIGRRYLIELRTRKNFFLKLNNMSADDQLLEINGHIYEDFQGYPLSTNCIEFLENRDENSISVKNKEITLIKLDCLSSGRPIGILKNKLILSNFLKYIKCPCTDFWNSMEPVDTSSLTSLIKSI
jgi:hypothetical protein